MMNISRAMSKRQYIIHSHANADSKVTSHFSQKVFFTHLIYNSHRLVVYYYMMTLHCRVKYSFMFISLSIMSTTMSNYNTFEGRFMELTINAIPDNKCN